MNESYQIGPPLVFIACPPVSSVVDVLIIMSLPRYLKPPASSGGTNSYFLTPRCGGSATAVVVATANKEVVALLSGTTTIYYNTYFTCTNHEINTLLTLLLVIGSHMKSIPC